MKKKNAKLYVTLKNKSAIQTTLKWQINEDMQALCNVKVQYMSKEVSFTQSSLNLVS